MGGCQRRLRTWQARGAQGQQLMDPRPWGSGGPYCAPGLGRAEAMWPCPEGALVCEETDEPLNGVTCPKAPSGLAHSHHAPPAPQAPPGAGGTDTDVGAKRLFPPPFPPSLFFPGFAKVPPTGAWPGVSLSTHFQKAQTWRSPYALCAQLWPPAPPRALSPGPCGIAARPRVFVP